MRPVVATAEERCTWAGPGLSSRRRDARRCERVLRWQPPAARLVCSRRPPERRTVCTEHDHMPDAFAERGELDDRPPQWVAVYTSLGAGSNQPHDWRRD